MGLTIRGEWNGSPEYDMGAISFFRLRRDTAYFIAKDFGDHYANMPTVICSEEDEAYEKQTLKLCIKYRLKHRLLDFLYSPDTDYRLSPAKCKVVYDLIMSSGQVEEHKTLYGYGARPEKALTMKKFADLLLECYNRKKYLSWS